MNALTLSVAVLIAALSVLGCSKEQGPLTVDTRTSQLQDLAQLRRGIALDAAFNDAERARALALIRDAEARAGAWTAPEFELLVDRVMASTDNGHSTVWPRERARRFNRIPARLLLLADGVFVVRAKGAALPLLGRRIEAVDDVSIDDILSRLRVYRGGLGKLRDYDDVSLLESPELLHAAGLAKSAQAVTLTVSGDGETESTQLAALAAGSDEFAASPLRYLAALATSHEGAAWRSAFSARPTPLWLQDPDQMFRLVPLAELDSIYLQLKTNSDASDGERIGAFLSNARQSIAQHRPTNLILDMRFDSGGDYTTTASFMSHLHEMIPRDGRIFVITHTATFSAGITSIGFVKQASPRQTVILGEPVGDRLIFYGEPRRLKLPTSGIEISYATGLHDYLHGCRWFGPCYWVNWIYPISVESLDPEFMAPMSFVDTIAGRDPAMEAVSVLLKPSRLSLQHQSSSPPAGAQGALKL